jgi:adenylyltransferase/sulfurtransferase
MELIYPKEFKVKFESGEINLVDIRELYEYQVCQIGGLHIPMDQVVDRIADLQQLQPICVMCKSGKRAAAVANMLVTEFEFERVFVLDGGISAYIEQVDPSLELYD